MHIPADMMDRRLVGAGAAGGHKMSMLQDLERGRSLEIDALVDVRCRNWAAHRGATPVVDAVLALVKSEAAPPGCMRPGLSQR